VIVALCLLVATALIAGRLGLRLALASDFIFRFDARTSMGVMVLGVASLLVAPSSFAAESVANGNGAAWLPQAGPNTGSGFGGPGGGGPGGARAGGPSGAPAGFGTTAGRTVAGASGSVPAGKAPNAGRGNGSFGPGAGGAGPGGGGGGGAITFAGSNTPTLDPGLVSYLERHRGSARYLVATATSTYASLFILQTGQPVMALGGYQGWDKILTLAQLKRQVAQGTIRYFLLSGSGSPTRSPGGNLPGGVDAGLSTVNNGLETWVTSTCSVVPTSTYSSKSKAATTTATSAPGGGFGTQGVGQLYDCGT
jgi:hypothetical protein